LPAYGRLFFSNSKELRITWISSLWPIFEPDSIRQSNIPVKWGHDYVCSQWTWHVAWPSRDIHLNGLSRSRVACSQNNQCPAWDSNGIPSEHKSSNTHTAIRWFITIASYFGDPEFESYPRDRPFWLEFSFDILNPLKRLLE
jgi:hypothetical protein